MSICQHFVYIKMSIHQHFVVYKMSVNQHFVVVSALDFLLCSVKNEL